jgi:phosphoglycolate phosphatase-like HAD superfamily hydrolase
VKVALDFDGTLCDSMGALEDLASEVVREVYPAVPGHVVRGHYRRTAGMPFGQQAAYLPIPHPARQRAVTEFEERKVAVTLACRPFEDVWSALRTWHAAGVDVVVVSSTVTDLLQLWLRKWALLEYVTQVYGLSYGTKLEQLQRCRPDAFCGDTRWDLVKATEVGVTFHGVQRDERLLPDSGAVTRDLSQLATATSVRTSVHRFLDSEVGP